MTKGVTRSAFRGCTIHQGRLAVPAGTRLVKQGVALPERVGGGRGHVYHHAGTGQWFTVAAVGPQSWRVCVYVGGTCPCGG